MARKRNGCKPRATSAHGLRSSARPSTGPPSVQNITSAISPGMKGLSTLSRPPVSETICNLAVECCPSRRRMVVGGMPASRTRGARVGGWFSGEGAITANMLRVESEGEITKDTGGGCTKITKVHGRLGSTRSARLFPLQFGIYPGFGAVSNLDVLCPGSISILFHAYCMFACRQREPRGRIPDAGAVHENLCQVGHGADVDDSFRFALGLGCRTGRRALFLFHRLSACFVVAAICFGRFNKTGQRLWSRSRGRRVSRLHFSFRDRLHLGRAFSLYDL